MMVELAMGAMSLMKQVVNEKGAYAIQQGQRRDFTGKDLDAMKASATTFVETTLLKKADITLSGIETINGKDAYGIRARRSKYDANHQLWRLQRRKRRKSSFQHHPKCRF